nr:reverse transcriptase domain-containing protein [Tanacetum cinerariifolium]
MSSDSHATLTYTSMSSYEVIVNGPEAPPSPDYIPGPEAPPSPDYILGPEAPPSPDYILGPKGDDDTDDDGDNLSEDDADDEDEEESSDSEEEEEEHLALTVPTPVLHSSIPASEDSDETEPFEKSETAATSPPFGYRVASRISVQPHILIPFCLELEVERLLAIPTPPLSPVSPTSYPLPQFLMPLPIFAPLPTSSFPLPLSLASTSGSESIPEADIPLRKRARFNTPTDGYEIGESSVVVAARQIRPTLTIAESRRADDRLIGRLRRERRYFRTLSTTYAHEVAHSRDYCTHIMDYFQSREVHTSILVSQIEALQRDVRENHVKFSYCILIGIALTWWNSHMRAVSQEVAYAMSWKTLKQMMTTKMFLEESDKIERKFDNTSRNQQNQQPFRRNNNVAQAYAVGSGEKSYRGTKPLSQAAKTNNNNNNNNYNNRRATTAYQGVPTFFECGAQGHFKNNYPRLGNRNQGNQNQAGNGNAVARAYGLGTAGGNPNADVVTELDSFDVIVGMDWLKTYHAVIVYDEKIVHVLFGNETLIIQCDGRKNRNQLNIISYTKTRKYLLKGYPD